MKRLLTTLCLVLLSVHSYSQDVVTGPFLIRDGITYHQDTNELVTLHCVMSKVIEQHTNGRGRSFDRESDSWFFLQFFEPVLKIKPDEKTISIDMGLNLVPNSELKNHTYSKNGTQVVFTDIVETTAGLYKSMYTLNKITERFEIFQEKFTHSISYANDKEAKWTEEKTSIYYYNCTKKEALF